MANWLAAIFQVRCGIFRLLNPQAQHFLATVGANAQR
jgi:hypothetical protein